MVGQQLLCFLSHDAMTFVKEPLAFPNDFLEHMSGVGRQRVSQGSIASPEDVTTQQCCKRKDWWILSMFANEWLALTIRPHRQFIRFSVGKRGTPGQIYRFQLFLSAPILKESVNPKPECEEFVKLLANYFPSSSHPQQIAFLQFVHYTWR